MKIENNTSIIQVYGVGNVYMQPTIVRISITISHISKTINEAQIEVNNKIKALLKLTNELNIENINTNSLNFYPEYDWKNSKRILLGQKVQQNINITITDIKNNIQKAKDLLDKITSEIELTDCNVNFGINNYEEKITEARNLAYNNALEKAKQYAKQANLEIIKTIKISEFEPKNDTNYEDDMDADCLMISGTRNNSTELPISGIEINSKLYCDFIAQ